MVEFESILPYIDQIESFLAKGKSPKTIANELGIPQAWMTIHRYKKKHFNRNKAATEAWNEERKKNRDRRLEEGKAEIINTLEVINLGKLRARQLLEFNLGDNYFTSDGEERTYSLGVASIHWPAGQKMICDLSKVEQELAGDDPESRKADALESWIDTRTAILLAVDNDPEAKEKIISALEQRRRPSVRSGSCDLGEGSPGLQD